MRFRNEPKELDPTWPPPPTRNCTCRETLLFSCRVCPTWNGIKPKVKPNERWHLPLSLRQHERPSIIAASSSFIAQWRICRQPPQPWRHPFIFALCDLLSLCKQAQLNSFINAAKDAALNVPISPTNLDAEQKSCCLLASPWRLTMPEWFFKTMLLLNSFYIYEPPFRSTSMSRRTLTMEIKLILR